MSFRANFQIFTFKNILKHFRYWQRVGAGEVAPLLTIYIKICAALKALKGQKYPFS